MAMRTPTMGMDSTGVYPNIAPGPEDLAAIPAGQPVSDFPVAQMPGTPVIPMQQQALPAGQPEEGSSRPPESDEKRGEMPKAGGVSEADLWRRAQRMRGIAAERVNPAEHSRRVAARAAEIGTMEKEEDQQQAFKAMLADADPTGGDWGRPAHIGLRQHVPLDDLPDGLLHEPRQD
jgi:hypothetical protein